MYIGAGNGVVRTAAVTRKPQTNRYVWEELNAVVGSPRKPTPTDWREAEEVPVARYPVQQVVMNFIYKYQFKDMKDMEALDVLRDLESLRTNQR